MGPIAALLYSELIAVVHRVQEMARLVILFIPLCPRLHINHLSIFTKQLELVNPRHIASALIVLHKDLFDTIFSSALYRIPRG